MLYQIKYASLHSMKLRLSSLACVIAINAASAIIGQLYNLWILSVTISSLTLCGTFVIFIITSVQSVRGLYTAPNAYHIMLTPVPGWKLLLGRIIPIVFFDTPIILIGVACVVFQSFALTHFTIPANYTNYIDAAVINIIYSFAGYLTVITSIFFAFAMSKSIFFRVKCSGFLGFISLAAALYILNLLDLFLIALAPFTRYGLLISVSIVPGFNVPSFVLLILSFLKPVLLFFATAYLIEKRINL